MNRPSNIAETAAASAAARAWAWSSLLLVLVTSFIAFSAAAKGESRTPQATRPEAPRPIRALYVTGGGFHDFVAHEAILPPAVAKQVNIEWTVDHTAGKSTEVLIERHKNTNWTKDFDVVLYNMSFSFVNG